MLPDSTIFDFIYLKILTIYIYKYLQNMLIREPYITIHNYVITDHGQRCVKLSN